MWYDYGMQFMKAITLKTAVACLKIAQLHKITFAFESSLPTLTVPGVRLQKVENRAFCCVLAPFSSTLTAVFWITSAVSLTMLASSSYAQGLPPEKSLNRSVDSYRQELLREQYETAIMRERTERAYLEHQAQLYEYQREYNRSSLQRIEQQRDLDRRTGAIGVVNQAANVLANIGWQIEVLSRGR